MKVVMDVLHCWKSGNFPMKGEKCRCSLTDYVGVLFYVKILLAGNDSVVFSKSADHINNQQ